MSPPDAITICAWGEDLVAGTEEALSLGRRLAAAQGADLRCLMLGPGGDPLLDLAGRYAVGRVDRIADERLAGLPPDRSLEALTQYCRREPPFALLFPQTLDSRSLAARLAGRLGSAVVMNAVDVEIDADGRWQVTASAYGGDTRAVYLLRGVPPHVIGVLPNAVAPQPAEAVSTRPELREIGLELGGVQEHTRVVEHARRGGPPLDHAQIIVAGGRGLGSRENYKLIEELAEVLGGMAGASRPLIDDGWVEPSRQVGLTGRITRPALYVAVGISGASQHMAGCAAAKTIVAVNRDPDAAIFRYARYGIVGDCLDLLPAMIRAAKVR